MLLIDDCFLVGMLLLIAVLIVAIICKVKPAQMVLWSCVYIYAVLVLGITLFPIPFQAAAYLEPVPNNFVPFKTILEIIRAGNTMTIMLQIGGNILLSLPYGVVLNLTVRKREWLYGFLPFLFPIIIELLQVIIGLGIGVQYRSFDVDDFLLNVLGAYFGILLCHCFPSSLKDWLRSKLLPNRNAKHV